MAKRNDIEHSDYNSMIKCAEHFLAARESLAALADQGAGHLILPAETNGALALEILFKALQSAETGFYTPDHNFHYIFRQKVPDDCQHIIEAYYTEYVQKNAHLWSRERLIQDGLPIDMLERMTGNANPDLNGALKNASRLFVKYRYIFSREDMVGWRTFHHGEIINAVVRYIKERHTDAVFRLKYDFENDG